MSPESKPPRDVLRVVATVLCSPARFVRLLRLGPRGLCSMARFLLPWFRAHRERWPRAHGARGDSRSRPAHKHSGHRQGLSRAGGCILAPFWRGRRAAHGADRRRARNDLRLLDNLCDRLPGVTERAFARLHDALLDAVDDRRLLSAGNGSSYYADGPFGDDGGYLHSLVLDTRRDLMTLPHYPAVRDALIEVAGFYSRLQTLKHGAAEVREEVCGRWYAEHRERFPGLYWWEFAAACGSSLPVFALLYLAAQPRLDVRTIEATLAAYFPNVSAVHILLDYFIDQAEDIEHRELNFMACYASPAEAIDRFRRLLGSTRERLALLAHAGRHEFLLRAMCLFYLTHPKVYEQRLDRESAALLSAL